MSCLARASMRGSVMGGCFHGPPKIQVPSCEGTRKSIVDRVGMRYSLWMPFGFPELIVIFVMLALLVLPIFIMVGIVVYIERRRKRNANPPPSGNPSPPPQVEPPSDGD